ncbi:MAG TPA: universal stress protein [Vicinamibacterales bacterium]
MPRVKEFRVLVASDGSLSATAATMTAKDFPWPPVTRAFGVVAREAGSNKKGRTVDTALEAAVKSTAEMTTKALVGRWSGVRVRIGDGPPTAAIVRAAKRARADVIVMGWRGHGAVRRLLAGSVSRSVVREAPCAVLVVKRAARNVRTLVVGVDGSEQSERAVQFASRLQPPEGGRILLVTAAPLISNPSSPLLPSSIREAAASGVASINRKMVAEARDRLHRLAKGPRAAGWKVDTSVTNDAPLRALLATVNRSGADVLIVGATGASQLRRLLLGGVAQGALDRSPVPVLIVR